MILKISGYKRLKKKYLVGLSPLFIAFKVRADDRRQSIIIKIAATVRITPPMTADRMVIRDKLSVNRKNKTKNQFFKFFYVCHCRSISNSIFLLGGALSTDDKCMKVVHKYLYV